jgi:hypothetical protein
VINSNFILPRPPQTPKVALNQEIDAPLGTLGVWATLYTLLSAVAALGGYEKDSFEFGGGGGIPPRYQQFLVWTNVRARWGPLRHGSVLRRAGGL